MPFLNAEAQETFKYYEGLGLTANMVLAEMYRSRDTRISKSLVRMAATRNRIPLVWKETGVE